GGIGALLLQMLHPLALAGVWDHSNFRDDLLGRLRRTGQFISATTYGPLADDAFVDAPDPLDQSPGIGQ
ncbi:oxygenase MpaB family protein, partial [Pseudomonas aeruginosa]